MISRWCAGPPQTFQICEDVTKDEWISFKVDPHVLCRSQRHPGHNDASHRYCCWSVDEAESRDCTCECHQ